MFRSVVFMFPDVSFVAPRFHAGIDHHKGCRPEQLSSVGVPLPNCRASLPPGIFLMVDVGLGEISAYWRGQAV